MLLGSEEFLAQVKELLLAMLRTNPQLRYTLTTLNLSD